MEVTVAESGPCRRTLTIMVPADQVRAHIDEVFVSASQQVQLKGFRPGKVPRKVLEKKYGDEILGEAKERLINQSFENALREHRLVPLGRPDLEGVDDKPLDASVALQFQVHIEVRPEFELGNCKGLETKRGDSEVNDEDMESALNQLAGEKRTLQKVDEAVQDGDFVKMLLVFKNEAGEEVHRREGAQLNTNIPIAGTDPETFAARLRGAETGQTLDLEIEFPATFEKADVRGQKGTVEMRLDEVLRVVPAAIDEELAKSYDFESLDELKEKLRIRIGEEKTRVNRRRQEDDLIQILANENPFELPPSMIEDQTRHNLENFRERLKQSGVGEDEAKAKVEEARAEAVQDAERRVRTFFILDAIAKKEKIFVTEGDVEVELRNIAAQNNVSVGEVREHYEEHKLLPDLRLGLMERKVRDFLIEHATLTD